MFVKNLKFYNKIKAKNFFGKNYLSVRTRLLIFFLLLSIIPLLIIGYVSYQGAESTIEESVGVFSQQLASQITENVNFKLQELNNSTLNIISDRVLVQALL